MADPVQWSYSGSPSSSTKDQVRFLVGDTDPRDKQLDDREINWLLNDLGTPLEAAIAAAQGLQAMYARKVDQNSGKSSEGLSVLAQHYADLAAKLLARRARAPVAAFAGGISRSDKLAQELDTDRVEPAFRRKLHDIETSRLDPLQNTDKDNFG